MRVVVTGAAGFIGSHLCAALLDAGDEVVGLDALTDYYSPELKRRNLALIEKEANFSWHRTALEQAPLRELLDGVDVVYHLAGQPGVRDSWGEAFAGYVTDNVLATQILLEAARTVPLRKLIYASSSSVYGDTADHPVTETSRPQPISPYGVTKLAAEHLCELYRLQYGVPTVSLRLFTVYGPRQRPDMAFARLVDAALNDRTFELNGDGEQTRDFTYVADVVRAMRSAAGSDFTGVANIGGGQQASMNQVIATLAGLVGTLRVDRAASIPWDMRHTSADTTRAREAFGYAPSVPLEQGLKEMVAVA